MNDIDVFKDDIGLTAIFDGGTLQGFNVSAGGGLSTTHGDSTTFPRLADLIGFATPEQITCVAEQIITIQRDFGNRTSTLSGYEGPAEPLDPALAGRIQGGLQLDVAAIARGKSPLAAAAGH
jgi:hypothetical protein